MLLTGREGLGKFGGLNFFGTKGGVGEFFSDLEGGIDFFFMPHWQSFLINVTNRLFS